MNVFLPLREEEREVERHSESVCVCVCVSPRCVGVCCLYSPPVSQTDRRHTAESVSASACVTVGVCHHRRRKTVCCFFFFLLLLQQERERERAGERGSAALLLHLFRVNDRGWYVCVFVVCVCVLIDYVSALVLMYDFVVDKLQSADIYIFIYVYMLTGLMVNK